MAEKSKELQELFHQEKQRENKLREELELIKKRVEFETGML